MHTGLAVHFDADDIDTDQLIPARFMTRSRADGYGDCLLHDRRRSENGKLDPAFVLERHPQASVLLVGRNFGCGSSREAAVYALLDAGIRVVVAPEFADIFAGNACNNGLLAARIDERAHATLAAAIGEAGVRVSVSLESARIVLGEHPAPDSCSVAFSLDDRSRTKLINGWDDIDLTLAHALPIARHRERRAREADWAWPAADGRKSAEPNGRDEPQGPDDPHGPDDERR